MLEAAVERVARRHGWDMQKAEGVKCEYEDFLRKSAYEGANFDVPSMEVDQLWHEHILDTRNYHSYCQNVIGCFVHHIPDKTAPLRDDETTIGGSNAGRCSSVGRCSSLGVSG